MNFIENMTHRQEMSDFHRIRPIVSYFRPFFGGVAAAVIIPVNATREWIDSFGFFLSKNARIENVKNELC